MARSVQFDCQRLEVFGHAVEAVAVLDELAEELPEGRGYIRDQLGFRRFSMRGLEQARGEWGLVCMCDNMRRLS